MKFKGHRLYRITQEAGFELETSYNMIIETYLISVSNFCGYAFMLCGTSAFHN